jgi:hypothetical protein
MWRSSVLWGLCWTHNGLAAPISTNTASTLRFQFTFRVHRLPFCPSEGQAMVCAPASNLPYTKVLGYLLHSGLR